jgi:hypothetical protein
MTSILLTTTVSLTHSTAAPQISSGGGREHEQHRDWIGIKGIREQRCSLKEVTD